MPSSRTIRLGTRGSPLARHQTELAAAALAQMGHPAEVVVIATSGDATLDRPLAAVGGKGLFIKEIEAALLAGTIDVGVHSLKDVPAVLPPGCRLAAVLERADPRDALVAAPGDRLLALPAGARVGTGSPRRRAQILRARPDLRVEAIRGNVGSRLERWHRAEYDALVLAAAGLTRLGHTALIAELLPPALMCPAAGQGVIALETRGDDAPLLAILEMLNHAATAAAAEAERTVVRHLGCDCYAPVGVHGWMDDSELRLRAVVASADGAAMLSAEAGAQGRSPAELGRALADALLAQGAAALLAESAP